MTENKKIMVSLPNSLLEELDFIISIEEKDRSQFIREAMKLYIREKKRVEVSEMLKDGYVKMSQINSTLAEEGFEQDMVELTIYETGLTRREKM